MADNELLEAVRKIDNALVELKRILEQVVELRLRCVMMNLRTLSSYQPLCLQVLETLNNDLAEGGHTQDIAEEES